MPKRRGSSNPDINVVYKWHARSDRMEQVGPSIRVLGEVQMYSGMTEKEVRDDLAGKRAVLDWLLRKNIKEVNDVGKIITEYYIDKETVLDLVESGKEA